MSQTDQPRTVTPDDWDNRYRSEDNPWDTGRPSAELVRAVESGFISPSRAIELGCGTGTNAIYLAEQGFHVTGVDLSAVAIDLARNRAQTAGVRVDFFVADVAQIARAISPGKPADFVFDRGCYHCVRRVDLAGYLSALDHLTRPGSKFLLLAGNPNEACQDGPPRVSEEEIRGELGGLFDVAWIRTFRFENPDASAGPLAWAVGMTRREE